MSLNERISKVIEYSELTSSEFADEIDVRRSSVSHIPSGRNKPSLDFITKVKDRFPELEWEWLINGNGKMIKEKEEPKEAPKVEKSKPASLPDLFSLINDDQFGVTESEDRVEKSEVPSDFPRTVQKADKNILNDSQRLATQEKTPPQQVLDNQTDRLKRVVLFFESGKFESFEP